MSALEPRPARHLYADDYDRAHRRHIGDRALIAFGIFVLLYFGGQFLRAWLA